MHRSTAGDASKRATRPVGRINTDGPRVGIVLDGITPVAKVLEPGESPVQDRFAGRASDDGAAAIMRGLEMIRERFARIAGVDLEAVRLAQ